MTSDQVPGGVVHGLPPDLGDALAGNATALSAWRDITPLARNEFICGTAQPTGDDALTA